MAEDRVLIVFHEPRAGGAVISVLRAIPHLAEMGWRFHFWVPRPSELHDQLVAEGYEVDGAPRYISHSIRALRLEPGPVRRLASIRPYLRRFREHLERTRPRLVHANTLLATTEGAVARRAGVPVMMHVHEMVPDDRRGRLCRWAAWNRFQGVVAVSQACGRKMEWRGHKPTIVYEAAPVPAEPVTIRCDADEFRIGTVGVLSQRKGTDLFVDAAAMASAREARLRFELIGGGADEREARWINEVLIRGRAAGVEYFERADVESRMRSWDAFALPARADPFPISMLEAMALGLPAIGADVDGISEQLADGVGLLCAPADAAALASGMVTMARLDADKRAEMGRLARERVRGGYTVEHQAAGLDRAYREALERKGGPALGSSDPAP